MIKRIHPIEDTKIIMHKWSTNAAKLALPRNVFVKKYDRSTKATFVAARLEELERLGIKNLLEDKKAYYIYRRRNDTAKEGKFKDCVQTPTVLLTWITERLRIKSFKVMLD